MKLTVKKLPDDDAWRDMVRIPHKYRVNSENEHIARGRVCRITVDGKSEYLVVRGYEYKEGEKDAPLIFVDAAWRGRLKLKPDREYDFTLKPGGILAEWLWIWRARDPLIRIPAQISVISFFLGILALLLAIPPSVDWVKAHLKHQSTESSATQGPAGQGPEAK